MVLNFNLSIIIVYEFRGLEMLMEDYMLKIANMVVVFPKKYFIRVFFG